MKKAVFIFFIFYSVILNAQNWRLYSVTNSSSPANAYDHMAIDTANTKWFTELWGSFYGDTLVYFNNVDTWQKRGDASDVVFNCRRILVDKSNTVWQVTYGGGYNAYSLTGGIYGTFNRYDHTTTGYGAMSSLYDMAIDGNNNKWFAGLSGLVKYDDVTFTLYDTTFSSLPFEPVFRMITDKYNNIWIFGDHEFAKYNGTSWQTLPSPYVFTSPSATFFRVVADSSDNIWLCHGAGGLYKFDGSTWTNYTRANSSIPSDTVTAVAVDKYNGIWICYKVGISHFDGTTWTNYNSSAGYPATNFSTSLEVDRYNNKWLLTSTGTVVFNETGIVNVNELDKEFGYTNLYPNPAINNLTVEFDALRKGNALIEIKNIFGQTIYSEVANDLVGIQSENIDISAFRDGVYFVQITTSKNTISKKFVKQ